MHMLIVPCWTVSQTWGLTTRPLCLLLATHSPSEPFPSAPANLLYLGVQLPRLRNAALVTDPKGSWELALTEMPASVTQEHWLRVLTLHVQGPLLVTRLSSTCCQAAPLWSPLSTQAFSTWSGGGVTAQASLNPHAFLHSP